MCRRSYRGNRRGFLSRKNQNWQPRGVAWGRGIQWEGDAQSSTRSFRWIRDLGGDSGVPSRGRAVREPIRSLFRGYDGSGSGRMTVLPLFWHSWALFLRSVSHLTFALGSRGYEGASQRTEGVLEKRDIVQKWSPDDWREFDRWIRANAVIGSLLAAGLLVMAVAGAPSAGSGDAAAAADSKGSEVGASVQSRLTPAP
jgi:hypothetical protein